MIEEGKKAPAFTLPDDRGEKIRLSDFKGKKVVLYFYPRDNTPGCTTEACGFRDVYDDIMAKGAVVMGVSTDSAASHQKFRLKLDLPFYLLVDEDHTVAEKYGAWGEKKMYGKTSFGIIRSTFVIDEKGKVIKVFPKVKPADHAAEVLALL